MTQPAKVQEPSMEEILASIRRIIADDEAKPPAAERSAGPPGQAKPENPAAAAPAAKAPAMKDIPPSASPAAQSAGTKPATPPFKAAPPAAAPPAASNSQDDIDAMLAGLDEATSEAEIRPPLPDGEVFELTDEMALPDTAAVFVPQDRTGGRSRIRRNRRSQGAASAAGVRTAAGGQQPRGSSASADFVALDRVCRRIRLQHPRQYRAEQQRADAGRSGQGNAAADAEILARRQFARHGGADRQGRNRAGFARTLVSRSAGASYAKVGIRALIQPLHQALYCFRQTRRVDLARSGGFLARSISMIASP